MKLEVAALGAQSEVLTPQLQQEDDSKKRAVLAALVEAGDLPSTVLSAWDKDDVIDVEVVENNE